MSNEQERFDNSLLASFLPKEGPDPRRSIPVQLDLGNDDEKKTAAPDAREEKKP